MIKKSVPGPSELERELNEYLSNKYGERVRLSVPLFLTDRSVMQSAGKGQGEQESAAKINFTMKPQELEAYLDEYVIKQDRAKEILATKICTHFNRIARHDKNPAIGNIKNNIIMLGPTGVGKTFLIKLIAQKIGVPFVKGDATKFSETGYVGGDVEDLVRDLVREAGGDMERARYGIIYIDEIDKIAGSSNVSGLDVSRTGVQRALLKPMEETDVDLKVPHDIVSQMEALEHFRKTGGREKRVINTKDILFIVSGAFSGLEEIIEKRLNRQSIGFGSDLATKENAGNILEQVKAEDLMAYGFESEFIGRLPVLATFHTLSTDDLYGILKNPNSAVVTSKKRDFKAYGIDIRFDENALRKIARMAAAEKTGARGLVSAIEKVLLKFEKVLPSTGIRKLAVTEQTVLDPETQLEKILDGGPCATDDERHRRLIQLEVDELRERIIASTHSPGGRCALPVRGQYLDNIVRIAVEQCLDYRVVLEDAALIVEGVHKFEEEFEQARGVAIHFDDGAVDSIIKNVLPGDKDVDKYLDDMFANYQHGLKLIRERTGRRSFHLTAEAMEAPQEYLNNLIRGSYREGAQSDGGN